MRAAGSAGAQETRPQASDEHAETLTDRVRAYWNARIHDLEMTRSPVGSAGFFRELDAYRFEKLDYLPRLVDFAGYRDREVLEIGCGVGTDLARFAQGGARVTGVDLSETAVELARQNFAHLGLSGDLRVADGTRLPFGDHSFDLVYCHGVLQYSADPEGIVREAARVLRPDGEAVFMVYNRRSWLAWMSKHLGVGLEHGDSPVFTLYTISEFDRLLRPFPTRRIVPERFPVATKLHHGAKGWLYNGVFVPGFRAIPRPLVRRFGWHLMAFCRKG
jgi:SAM-dependent methyltransferase